MVRIKRILEKRVIPKRGDLLKIFEKKISDAWELERECFMRKFSKKNQYQSRIQYIVFLVSCLEFFLEEIFKKAIDKKAITLKELKQFKKLKTSKFDLNDLEIINRNKIKLSEILAEEMNFQNDKDILVLLRCLNLDDNYKSIPKKSGGFDLIAKKGDSKEIIERKMKKNIVRYIVERMGKISEKDEDFLKMFGTIRRMIFFRHKIVHQAQVVKIENWESWAYSMATARLGYVAYSLYNLKRDSLK